MSRYRIETYKGIPYGLTKGQTVEQLAVILEKTKDEDIFSGVSKEGRLETVPNTGEVKGDYLVFDEGAHFLTRRINRKRSHRKRGFIRGNSVYFPRVEGEPEVRRPRFGKGSGRAGGARGATHCRSHLEYVPQETRPENCYICELGLEKAIRRQQSDFFNASEDKILKQFPNLPWELEEQFLFPLDTHRNVGFIERWKALEDRVKFRYLRAVMYREKVKEQECLREQEVLEEAKRFLPLSKLIPPESSVIL